MTNEPDQARPTPDRDASRTALATAYLRAAHQVLDASPRVLEDPVAVPLLGSTAVQQIQESIARLQAPEARALRAHVVLRSRFAEDRLAAAVRRGVAQYVVLGAGFDTFALRQPLWARGLRIFEVDHSGTQSVKRDALAAAGIALPENLVFASVDFDRESLVDGLVRHHASLAQPTFFSWLGVTMYLTEDAIDAVLRSVARFPTGSEIVLTFARPRGDAPSSLEERAIAVGEPWLSFFEPDALDLKLRRAGFREVTFLSPHEAEARYFRHRPRDLPSPHHANIVSAIL